MEQPDVGPRVTALLVEDSEVFRNIVKVYLGHSVSQVLEADDGDTALELLHQHRVDLVVSDLSMPRMSGLELLKQVRASSDKRLRTVPFVMLTAEQDEALLDEARRAGVDEFVHKPVKPSALKEVVQRVLSRG